MSRRMFTVLLRKNMMLLQISKKMFMVLLRKIIMQRQTIRWLCTVRLQIIKNEPSDYEEGVCSWKSKKLFW